MLRAAGPLGRAVGITKPAAAPDWLTTSIKPSISPIVVSMLAELAESGLSEAVITKAAVALRSPEAQQLQRMLVVNVITQRQQGVPNLKEQLIAVLIYAGSCERGDAETIATPLSRILLVAATRSVEALQAASGRYYAVLRQLALQEQEAGLLESLIAISSPTSSQPNASELAAIDRFAQIYMQEMLMRTADLVPQHFDTQVRIPLDQLYVAPRFAAIGDQVVRLTPMNDQIDLYVEEVIFPLVHAWRRMYRSVVLGAPGAGKTTLTQKLVHDLCSVTNMAGTCVPFLITLRKYDQRNENESIPFTSYISDYIAGELQIEVPRLAIEYLLASGRAMIIFDGLDELLRLDRRKDLVEAIHSFSRRYSSCSILVTSRIVGYDESPLDRKIFSQMYLTNLDEKAVETYAHNWFRLNQKLDPSEQASIATHFLRESSSVKELRSNPLLLSLMCNIFRGAGYIPQNRSDLYERCAVMLFDEWDQSRGIDSGGPLKADARYALQDIAYWALTSPELDSGIPEPQLKKRLTRFLEVSRYGSEAAASDAAADLLRLWRGRAWILTDLGSDVLHPIYQFTHRTFLEYFAASYIARTAKSPKRLWRMLRPDTISGQWDVVSQIALQAYNAANVGAIDRIYDLIIDDAKQMTLGSLETLRFACRYLDALAPGPQIVRRLVAMAIDLVLATLPTFDHQPDWRTYERRRDGLIPEIALSEDMFTPAILGDIENLEDIRDDPDLWPEYLGALTHTVRQINEPLAMIFDGSSIILSLASTAFDDYCKELVAGPDFARAAQALLLMLSKTQFIQSAQYMAMEVQGEEAIARRAELRGESAGAVTPSWALEAIPALRARNFWIPIIASRYHGVDVEDLIKISGFAGLFNSESPFDIAIESARSCFAEEIVVRYVTGSATLDDRRSLAETGRIVRRIYNSSPSVPQVDVKWMNSRVGGSVLTPFFLNTPNRRPDVGYYDRYLNGLTTSDRSFNEAQEPDPDVYLGAASMLMTFAEAEYWEFSDLSADELSSLTLGPVAGLEGLFLVRFAGPDLPESHLRARIGMPSSDMDILISWSDGSLDFTWESSDY